MVFVFIAATVGLLGWAAVRPWVAKWYEVCSILINRTLARLVFLQYNTDMNVFAVRRKQENDETIFPLQRVTIKAHIWALLSSILGIAHWVDPLFFLKHSDSVESISRTWNYDYARLGYLRYLR